MMEILVFILLSGLLREGACIVGIIIPLGNRLLGGVRIDFTKKSRGISANPFRSELRILYNEMENR